MNIKHILLFVCLTCLFASCDKDTDPVLPNYPASVLTHPENETLYELKKADADKEIFTLSWTASTQNDLAVTPALYYVQMDIAGRDFASAVTLAKIDPIDDQTNATTYSTSVTVKQLNSVIVQDLRMKPDSLVNVEFRVITNLGNALIGSSASNTFTAQVLPYSLVRESLFFVGNTFGENAWNNSSSQFILFRSTPDASEDTYTGKLIAGGAFKFITASNLGTWNAYGSNAKNSLSTDGGDIGGITTTGYYTVTANIEDLSYSIEPYDASKAKTFKTIGLVGDFNGWGSELALTQSKYDPHIWSAHNVVLTAGGAKFRADPDYADSWGGKTFPYGGGSGDNIPVVDGTYYIMFNDLTGEYVFFAK